MFDAGLPVAIVFSDRPCAGLALADEQGVTALAAVLPPTLHLTLERAEVLRYGENPHQRGARYRVAGAASWWDAMVQHGGTPLSYLNLLTATPPGGWCTSCRWTQVRGRRPWPSSSTSTPAAPP